MDLVTMAAFADELCKIAAGNVVSPMKPVVGGMGSNVIGKPLTSTKATGIGAGKPSGVLGGTPKPAKPTNYSMVHSNAPTAAFDAGAGAKMVPPPPVKT